MDFKLPDIGEGLVEAQIVKWYVMEGQQVVENQPLVEVLTDKANVEIPSPASGVVKKIYVEEGAVAKVGQVIVSFYTSTAAKEQEVSRLSKAESASGKVSTYETKVLASPAIRKLAKEKNINIENIKGSGPGGRVLLKDLETMETGDVSPTYHKEVSPAVSSVTNTSFHTIPEKAGVQEDVPIKGIVKAMFDRMTMAQKYSSIFTYVEECDATELVKLRENLQQISQAQGVKLTYLPFILKALSLSFKHFTKLNAIIDEKNLVLKIRKDCNIGVAMTVDNNLVVPVIKDIDKKNILQIAKDLQDLQQLAERGKLTPSHFQDGGFSVTSLGKFGGVFATPIVNYPQVSILGIHKISIKPVYVEGKIEPRHIMNLSISSDHRVIEGHYSAGFLQEVIRYLQDPKLLLLQLI